MKSYKKFECLLYMFVALMLIFSFTAVIVLAEENANQELPPAQNPAPTAEQPVAEPSLPISPGVQGAVENAANGGLENIGGGVTNSAKELLNQWDKLLSGKKYYQMIKKVALSSKGVFEFTFGKNQKPGYEFVIFLNIFLFFVFAINFSRIIKTVTGTNGGVTFFMGMGMSFIVAKMGVLGTISDIINFIPSLISDSFWVRLIIIIIIVAIIMALNILAKRTVRKWSEKVRGKDKEEREKEVAARERNEARDEALESGGEAGGD